VLKTVAFLLVFPSCKTQWPADLGNLCSNKDLATKFCISLGKSLQFSEADFIFSVLVLRSSYKLFFHLTMLASEHITQERTYSSVHSTLFHLESYEFSFNLV